MKRICLILLLIMISLRLISQEKPAVLATNPEFATILTTSQEIVFQGFLLSPKAKIETGKKQKLQNISRQNYYFQFVMPENKDALVNIRLAEEVGANARILAYLEEANAWHAFQEKDLRSSKSTFNIGQSSVLAGEMVIICLMLPENLKNTVVEIGIKEKSPKVKSKNFFVDQTGYSEQALINDVLLSSSVATSNVEVIGDTISIGYFSGSIVDTGFENGIIMSTGHAAAAVGPNESASTSTTTTGGSDPDLQALIPGFTVNDAVIIEFDFVANDNHMVFDYIFASEEFHEFANSSFNDVFGFFLSGPGINGPYSNNAINIALLPNGDVVTIDNTFNDSSYYVGSTDNNPDLGQAYNNDMEYDGASIPLIAEAILWQGETYHIKLAIGDAGDSSYDSAVFLKGSSFNTGSMATGKVYYDINQDGFFGVDDIPLPGIVLQTDIDNLVAISENTGFYSMPLNLGTYNISAVVPPLFDILNPASGSHNVTVDYTGQELDLNNFALISNIDCPLLNVDISGEDLTECNTSTLVISFNNDGTVMADNVVVNLELNENLSLLSSEISYTEVGVNTYAFDLGDLNVFESGLFELIVQIDCDIDLEGQTLCGNATISADNQCTFLNPGIPADTIADAEWDHSGIEVTGYCDGDTEACFTITNEGDPGQGDMAGPSEYRIFANDTLIFTDVFQLNGGETLEICWETNGRAIRLEADQRPGHPGNSHPQFAVENCGDYNGTSLGYILSTQLDDYNAYEDIWCGEVQAFGTKAITACKVIVSPKGIGNNHFVDQDVKLNYTIFFQNPTEFVVNEVVIRDSLSAFLDFKTVEFIGSSHDCEIHLSKEGIITWRFNDINLATASSDEEASKGFASFIIAQKPANDYGEVIRNKATSFFDNKFVFTSEFTDVTVWDLPLIFVNKPENSSTFFEINVFPNPASTKVRFVMPEESTNAVSLSLFDNNGRLVRQLNDLNAKQFNLELDGLSSGTYYYEIAGETSIFGKGKLIVN
ncbi:MAG: choice-of-anchor L domain-containing protein [Bacteroidales bacterium]|jgi:hypothetical protein|nr:choice-of-anchor L domain-containing protein [Bacteroidales bacterium]